MSDDTPRDPLTQKCGAEVGPHWNPGICVRPLGHDGDHDDSDVRVLDAARPSGDEALNNAYRERNAVVAALIRTNGWKASLIPAPDAEGWWIVYAETPAGQVSWHIAPVDIRLFDGIPVEYAKWDGHTTDEKYERIAALAAAPPSPYVLDVERLRGMVRGIALPPGPDFAWVAGHREMIAAMLAVVDRWESGS